MASGAKSQTSFSAYSSQSQSHRQPLKIHYSIGIAKSAVEVLVRLVCQHSAISSCQRSEELDSLQAGRRTKMISSTARSLPRLDSLIVAASPALFDRPIQSSCMERDGANIYSKHLTSQLELVSSHPGTSNVLKTFKIYT